MVLPNKPMKYPLSTSENMRSHARGQDSSQSMVNGQRRQQNKCNVNKKQQVLCQAFAFDNKDVGCIRFLRMHITLHDTSPVQHVGYTWWKLRVLCIRPFEAYHQGFLDEMVGIKIPVHEDGAAQNFLMSYYPCGDFQHTWVLLRWREHLTSFGTGSTGQDEDHFVSMGMSKEEETKQADP